MSLLSQTLLVTGKDFKMIISSGEENVLVSLL